MMTGRPAVTFAAIFIILSGLLFAFVLGFLLLSFIPAPASTNATPQSPDKEQTPEKQATPQRESTERTPASTEPSVAVEVVDTASRPVEGASIHDVRNYSTALAETDVDGKCSIPHAALQFERRFDVATIRVEHPNHASAVVRFARHTTPLRVVLSDMGILEVRVVDGNQAPIPRAVVELDEPERMIGAVWARERRTDENGKVTIPALRPGPYIVRAWAAGFAEGRVIAFARSKEAADTKVVLKPGRALEIRVLASDGKPVAGSKVSMEGGAGGSGWSPNTGFVRSHWIRATGADGVATFECLSAGIVSGHLTVEGPTHPPKLEEFKLDESTRRIDVTVAAGASLIVEVVDVRGTPVDCLVSIYAWSRSGDSQDLGMEKSAGTAARFTGIVTGRPFEVTVRRHGAQVHKETLELSASEERALTIRLPAESRVDLVARDGEGAPVSGSVILREVKATRDEKVYAVQLGPSGTASASLFPGTYKVELVPKEGVRVERTLVIDGDAQVVLEVPTGRTLEGVLVDPQGLPMAGCMVMWSEGEMGWWQTVTAHDGTFRLKRIPGASGRLAVEIQGFRLPVHQGPLPTDGRFVAPVSTISGRVHLPDGRPTAAIVQVQGESLNVGPTTLLGNVFGAGEDGTFRIQVPAGRWSLWAWAGDFEASSIPVDASGAGSTPVVTIRLAPVQK